MPGMLQFRGSGWTPGWAPGGGPTLFWNWEKYYMDRGLTGAPGGQHRQRSGSGLGSKAGAKAGPPRSQSGLHFGHHKNASGPSGSTGGFRQLAANRQSFRRAFVR